MGVRLSCYCDFCNKQGNSTEWCPTVKFKVSSRELFRKSAIIVEVNDRLPKKHKKKFFTGLPADFWDFIPKDEHQEESNLNQKIRVLSHAQVTWPSYIDVKSASSLISGKLGQKWYQYISHHLCHNTITIFSKHCCFYKPFLVQFAEFVIWTTGLLIWFCSNCCHN